MASDNSEPSFLNKLYYHCYGYILCTFNMGRVRIDKYVTQF